MKCDNKEITKTEVENKAVIYNSDLCNSDAGIKVILCTEELGILYKWIEVTGLDKEYKLDFESFGKIDKFIKGLHSTIMCMDLAGGIDDVYSYLEHYTNDGEFYSLHH